MVDFRLETLVAAVFTPMTEKGQLALERIGTIVDHLERIGVGGYLCMWHDRRVGFPLR
jgi:dihydrodipicolinate synthase/N-acetylneuraminate lyase